MTSLYPKWLEFRATLNLPETFEPLVTVPRVRGERTPLWKGDGATRRSKSESNKARGGWRKR